MGCTKSTISIRFDVQLKNDFDFDFDDRNISKYHAVHIRALCHHVVKDTSVVYYCQVFLSFNLANALCVAVFTYIQS